MAIFVVFLALVALGALLVHSNHRKVDRLTAARPGSTRVETVKAHQVDVTVRQHAATGWQVVDQSSAKSFGSAARVTLTFRKS
jgi:hypothetical protein